MAKKEKQNVKDKSKENTRNTESQNSGGSFSPLLMFTVAVSLLVSVAAFQVYWAFTHVPDLPQMDLDEYWGPKNTAIRDTAIRPFKVMFTDTMQEEMRLLFELYRRESDPKKPKSFNETGWTYGVNSEGFTEFFTEWIFDYSFRERSKFLNKFDHFKTVVQGLDLHFLHVKPKVDRKNVKVYTVPLLLLHGWPGSVREFYETIPRLIAPKKGYNFVFEVIVPSLPGFIYSQGASRPGLSPVKIAVILRNLMHRLGHKQFYVQGGDFGHSIGSHMATLFPKEVLGFHTSFPVNFSKLAFLTWVAGSVWPGLMRERHLDRLYPLADRLGYYLEESGYMHMQSTKPDTIGIALQDSPVGLASYILDRFLVFTDPENRERLTGGLDRYYSMEKLIDNIMLYWDSRSITTAMRLYKEAAASSELEQIMARIPTPVPTWALKLRHELVYQPDWLLGWKFPTLAGSSVAEYGGHFAAFERPKTFADDLFVAVKAFRSIKV